jgi:hypothetical protein
MGGVTNPAQRRYNNMYNPKKQAADIISKGTGQDDRSLPALEEGYINADGMSLESYISMSADFADLIKFFNSDNKEDGTWKDMFYGDETALCAIILKTDPDNYKTKFQNSVIDVKKKNSSEYFLPVKNICDTAKLIDLWYKKLNYISGAVQNNLVRNIENYINKKLKKAIYSLIEFTHKYCTEPKNNKEHHYDALYEDFDPIWGINTYEKGALFRQTDSPSFSSKESEIDFLASNFNDFYNALLFIKKSASDYLSETLQKNGHPPAPGLFISFLKLFQKAQKKLNRFTEKHRDFYYKDVLHMEYQPFAPDSAYLVFETDAEKGVFIDKDTEFIAKEDENGNDLIYVSDYPLHVNNARIVSAYTLYLEKNRLLSTGWPGLVTGIRKNNIVLSPDNLLESYPVFGAYNNTEGVPVGIECETGIAVTSPVLILNEGERKIKVKFYLDYKSDKTIYNGLNKLWEKLDYIGENKNDAFFKAFGRIFNISLTTETGWFNIKKYRCSGSVIEPELEKGCLEFSFELNALVPPIAEYSAEVHGNGYETDMPVMRFILNKDSYIYPYTILADLIIKKIHIDVEVTGAKDVVINNSIGPLDPNNTFQPFGPIPAAGSYFITGNFEAARKQVNKFNVNIEWGGLPLDKTGFKGYYKSYEPYFDNYVFKVKTSFLKGGKWTPENDDNAHHINLFKDASLKDMSVSKNIKIEPDLENLFKPLDKDIKKSDFTYDIWAESGFFRFTLSDPSYAFGHNLYPALLAEVLTENAKRKLRKPLPVPNTPYTPVINRITIDYTASTTLNMDKKDLKKPKRYSSKEKVFHITPFGFERMHSDNKGVHFIPQIKYQGNLFLGISLSGQTDVFTIFFHLDKNCARSVTSEPPSIFYHYLSGNKWKEITKDQILSDTTDNFIKSGIIVLKMSEKDAGKNSVMPENLFWIRIAADKEPESFCSVYSIMSQSVKVTWKNNENTFSHLKEGIPAGAIKKSRISIPGLTKICQVTNSFNGRPKGDDEHLKIRTGERLRHKNRGVAVWDYERLILERFPEIYKVKCFPCMSTKKWPEPHPGHILITVIPQNKHADSAAQYEPLADTGLLKDILEYIKNLSSSFVNIEVRNPVYETIQIRCSAGFEQTAGTGYNINRLNKALRDYISPWNNTVYKAPFGWRIRSSDIESFIMNLDYVNFVTNFSMLRIYKLEKNKYHLTDTVKDNISQSAEDYSTKPAEITPKRPWSIAVPMKKHFIKALPYEDAKNIEARITGIDELEIEDTFIINQ